MRTFHFKKIFSLVATSPGFSRAPLVPPIVLNWSSFMSRNYQETISEQLKATIPCLRLTIMLPQFNIQRWVQCWIRCWSMLANVQRWLVNVNFQPHFTKSWANVAHCSSWFQRWSTLIFNFIIIVQLVRAKSHTQVEEHFLLLWGEPTMLCEAR